MDKFWEVFEKYLELCHKALRCRHERLLGTKSDVAPILWQHGAMARLKKGETIDKLMYGSGARKMLLVISDESEKIAQRISNEVGRGVTLFKATGAYTGKERIVVMCFCSKR